MILRFPQSLLAQGLADNRQGASDSADFLQRHLETPLAKTLIRGDTHDGQTLHITLHNGALTLTPAPANTTKE
ncbi:MAG: hypothetical protein LBD14_03380 [Puniceicoccales bacterium]|nr:hypothetical protein [Puniceicoccales bacterium]